ncbi:SlyX family protein [Methylococcus sp. EFPC2]|uniref:SlyX family protein n=1 Tax=Methylococcus sp. EFPC2 TaxID=2812648 RepID=UPI0019675B8C|nr:SlyX family protein [Methylococcus sp. EFPC2]QSA95657.1 SlyX family protein [Methylococcus sp. EFPC2]
MPEDRWVEIETKLAYQEDAVVALNDVVCRQQKQIDQLEETCRLLIERLRQLSEGLGPVQAAEERPPHY